MKTIIIILSLSLFSNIAAQVNPDQEMSKIAKDKYLAALKHENHGVVSSSMNNIIHLKLVFPELKMIEIENTLKELEKAAPTKVLRYKAFITRNFIQKPDRFSWLTDNMIVLEKIDQRLDRQIKAVADAKLAKDSLLVADQK